MLGVRLSALALITTFRSYYSAAQMTEAKRNLMSPEHAVWAGRIKLKLCGPSNPRSLVVATWGKADHGSGE